MQADQMAERARGAIAVQLGRLATLTHAFYFDRDVVASLDLLGSRLETMRSEIADEAAGEPMGQATALRLIEENGAAIEAWEASPARMKASTQRPRAVANASKDLADQHLGLRAALEPICC